jgi:hypothetical protein
MGRKISKIECGSCLPLSDGEGKSKGPIFGNTCFFNSLLAGLRRLRHPASDYSYETLLVLGEWPEEKRGKMVDTIDDEHNLIILANALGVIIDIHSEINEDEVSSVYEPFAPEGIRSASTVNVVKLKNRSHFNFCEFQAPEPLGGPKLDLPAKPIALNPRPAVANPAMGARQPLLEKPATNELKACSAFCGRIF